MEFLDKTIKIARRLTDEPLLFTLDSGHDAGANIGLFKSNHVDFIIKRNLRSESPEDWLKTARNLIKTPLKPRNGKTVYIGSTVKNPDQLADALELDGQSANVPEQTR